jgi:hypothetical protein
VEALEKRPRNLVRVLPETATRKVDRRWPWYALAVMGLAAMLLAAAALVRGWSFVPGEKLYAKGFEDVAVSTEDTAYPPSDVLRFEHRPEVVYVYLAVEDLPRGADLEARVERSGSQSALAWLLVGRDGLVVSDGQEEHLGPSGGGVAGVVKFAVRTGSGEPLPAGEYTVSIYAAGQGAMTANLAARKYFLIQD